MPTPAAATSSGIHSPEEFAGILVTVIVVITPDGSTLRITVFPVSAINKFPAGSKAIPSGKLSEALRAWPPSPE